MKTNPVQSYHYFGKGNRSVNLCKSGIFSLDFSAAAEHFHGATQLKCCQSLIMVINGWANSFNRLINPLHSLLVLTSTIWSYDLIDYDYFREDWWNLFAGHFVSIFTDGKFKKFLILIKLQDLIGKWVVIRRRLFVCSLDQSGLNSIQIFKWIYNK